MKEILLIGALLAISCTRERPRSISLERTWCYGGCEAYRVVIAANGEVEYNGDGYSGFVAGTERFNPEYPTRASSTLSPAVAEAVFAAYDEGWSRWRSNRYSFDREKCAYDASTMWMVREYAARADTMELYYGCFDAPARLAEAAQKVDALIGIERWLGPSPIERVRNPSLRHHAARLCRPSAFYPLVLEVPAAGGYRLDTKKLDSMALANWLRAYLPIGPPERRIVFVRMDSARATELRWLVPAIERAGGGAYEPDSACMPPIHMVLPQAR